MSQILFDEDILSGHLTITRKAVSYHQHGWVFAHGIMRSVITDIEVKKDGNWKIMIHGTRGRDLVIESIKPSTGERVLSILQ